MVVSYWDDVSKRWCSHLPAANLPYKEPVSFVFFVPPW
jgi:hypothetical protein